MMKSTSVSAEARCFESSSWVASRLCPGVSFRIAKMTVRRASHLAAQIHEALSKLEYHEAGNSPADGLRRAELRANIEMLYVRWGLLAIRGLTFDGAAATPETLLALGPRELCSEAVAAIKRECGLNEDERKN